MSTEHQQRNKGQGNTGTGKQSFNNRIGDEGDSSWRNQQQQQHHQGYGSSMNTTSDPYLNQQQQPYYGAASFQYLGQVNEGGPWSNGNDMTIFSGYSAGIHDNSAPPPPQGYNIDGNAGMFGNGGGFGNFGGQPSMGGYGFHGDYSTWGPRKQHYEDYYRDGMEQGMGGLNLSEKEMKENQKKTTWATIASQPAKQPTTFIKKKPGMPLMPPPPSWDNKNGSVAKAIAAPIQAPMAPIAVTPRPAWERPKIPPPQQQQPPPSMPPAMPYNNNNSRGGYQSQNNMGYLPPQAPVQSQPPPSSSMQSQHSHNNNHQNQNSNSHHQTTASTVKNNVTPPRQQQTQQLQEVAVPSPNPQDSTDDSKVNSEYNPSHFDLSVDGARFFVIKSYSEDDIHRSIKYEIWCSTEHGNKRLDQAFREREGKGPVYLFFSVNSSGHFCGIAQMMSMVDYEASASVWCSSTDKWKGQFKVKWIYVKDVPNSALRHIKLENNEDKAVTNSRDTQEVPFEKGKLVLKIIHSFHHTTSIFDDFIHYEKRQEEEDNRKTNLAPNSYDQPHARSSHYRDIEGNRGGRGGGRGGHQYQNHHQGGYNSGGYNDGGGHGHPRDNYHDNPRGSGGGDYHQNMRGGRDHYRGGGGDRENFFGRGGGGGERDFNQRGDHSYRGSRGGPRPRN